VPRVRDDKMGITKSWKAWPLKFGRAKKCPKFGAIFGNFQLRSRISPVSGTDELIANPKSILSTTSSSKLDKKFGKLWSTGKRVIGAHIDPPKRKYFGRLHFGPWGCCPLKFLHALQIDQDLLAHTTTATGVSLKNLIVKI